MRLFILAVSLLTLHLAYGEKFDVSDHIKQSNDSYKDRVSKSFNRSRSNTIEHKSRINKIENIINSESYLKRKEELAFNLAVDMGVEPITKKKPENDFKSPLPKGHTPILFVSSSMPIDVLHRYAVDLSKVGGVMALRGTIGGISKLKPTIKFKNALSKSDLDCKDNLKVPCERLNITITIDPKRFIKNNVKRVPALIFEKDFINAPYCESGEPKKVNNIAYGDSSIEGLLQSLYTLNDDRDLLLPIDILQGEAHTGSELK